MGYKQLSTGGSEGTRGEMDFNSGCEFDYEMSENCVRAWTGVRRLIETLRVQDEADESRFKKKLGDVRVNVGN